MIELLIVNLWIIAWAFEAKSDLMTKVAEKLYDTFFILVLICIQTLSFALYVGVWQSIALFWLLILIHFVFHDIFINLWRGLPPYNHFTVDNPKDWFDKIHVWFYKRGMNLSIIATIVLIVSEILYYIFLT